MRVDEVVRELSLGVLAGTERLDLEVTGAYAGDLLSRVMAGARPGNLWVTVQAHPNVVAVGVLGELAGVIVAEGVTPDPVALQQLPDGGARQRTQLALPVVVASKARIAHFLCIELPRVAH